MLSVPAIQERELVAYCFVVRMICAANGVLVAVKLNIIEERDANCTTGRGQGSGSASEKRRTRVNQECGCSNS